MTCLPFQSEYLSVGIIFIFFFSVNIFLVQIRYSKDLSIQNDFFAIVKIYTHINKYIHIDTRTCAYIFDLHVRSHSKYFALKQISLFSNVISSYLDAVVEHQVWHAPIWPMRKYTHTLDSKTQTIYTIHQHTTVPSGLRVKCTVEHEKIFGTLFSFGMPFFLFFLLVFQCIFLWLIYAPFICTLWHQIVFGKDVWPINFERQSISWRRSKSRQNYERLTTITSTLKGERERENQHSAVSVVTIDTN